MESTAKRNKIQLSQETAQLLTEAGKEKWLISREDKVEAKGKGMLETYWLKIVSGSKSEDTGSVASDFVPVDKNKLALPTETKYARLIDWNVSLLSDLLKKIVVWRVTTGKKSAGKTASLRDQEKGMTLDEVKEIIQLPEFNEKAVQKLGDGASSTELDSQVVNELKHLISKIASMYRENPFHNFEHASHVTMSVMKMMSRIIDPKEIVAKKRKGDVNKQQLEAEKHDHTFGITSDP